MTLITSSEATVLAALSLSLLSALATLEPGTYALEVEVYATTEMPFIGAQQSVTRTVSHVVVDESAAAVAVPCSMTTVGPGFSSRVPRSSLKALPPARFTFAVDGDTVRGDMGTGRLGFEGPGALPENDKDVRVRDSDGDGRPGMRVEVNLGALGEHTIQMVGVGRTVLTGKSDESGAAGKVSVRSQERVLSGLPMGATPAPSQIDGAKSRFLLKKVTAQSCAALEGTITTASR